MPGRYPDAAKSNADQWLPRVSGTRGIDYMRRRTYLWAMTAPTREEFAERLLRGSVKKSYAPVVDIDWDAPPDPDKFYLPPKTVSLYGTPLWDSMTRAEQIELSRQELVNTLSAGIWFENILDQSEERRVGKECRTRWWPSD